MPLNSENLEKAMQKAVLAAADIGEYDMEKSLNELEELAFSAGAQVLARAVQKRQSFDSATCLGEGRLRELKDFCLTNDVDLIIFDHELTGSQIRNIENITDVHVIDRTSLILDIFAQRAKSREGVLQVHLAQLKYRLPRLSGFGTELSRLGGGIGTRGPGETKLETDRRHIRRQIAALEEELRELTRRRENLRERRKKNSALVTAIVGYTNVGKSTLLNALTNAGVLAQDMLFATLDPTARTLTLPDNRKIILIDTVGLISRLPHSLVEAFKSTLEEAAGADVILNLCDAADPNMESQLEITTELLKELGVHDTPVITVCNKCDMIDLHPSDSRNRVYISAKTGEGLDRLLLAVQKNLPETARRLRLLLPFSQGRLIPMILQEGSVFSQEYRENGIFVDALVNIKIFGEVKDYIL